MICEESKLIIINYVLFNIYGSFMKFKLVPICFGMLMLLLVTSCNDSTTTPAPEKDPDAYTNANGINGGILFDKFWSVESGFDQANPNIAKLNASSDFFRCKQCHAWDLLGRNGSYNNRAPKTNRPNIADRNLRTTAKNLSAQALFNAIKNGINTPRRDISADLSGYNPATNATVGDQMPKFSQILTDAQIWNLVKFLKVEALDVTQLYDATYSGTYPTGTSVYSNIGKDGDAAVGLEFYKAKCQVCHGVDGKQIANLDATPGMTTGKFVRSKPNELQHKIKFGQLGTIAPLDMKATPGTITDFKNLYKVLADVVLFPN
ncbi:MAG: hypothetical protein HW421_4021 [Ignavibacteria bacterium]|nr:hypothetical protein [Ignavibacteria bacterium]